LASYAVLTKPASSVYVHGGSANRVLFRFLGTTS
jgi:hypothetical protein